MRAYGRACVQIVFGCVSSGSRSALQAAAGVASKPAASAAVNTRPHTQVSLLFQLCVCVSLAPTCLTLPCCHITPHPITLHTTSITQTHRVRHEAAEALGAIAAPECLQLLQQHTSDSCQEVAETCQLALGRLAYLEQKQAAAAAKPAEGAASGSGPSHDDAAAGQGAAAAAAKAEEEEESPYYSVDPTPALPASTPLDQLRSVLLDPQQPMFEVSGWCWCWWWWGVCAV